MRNVLLAIVLGIALAGCGGGAVAGTAAPAPYALLPALATPRPVALTVPALDLHEAPLVTLGLNPDGTMATPPVTEPQQLGWYELGAKPGDTGPAVFAGHVSGRPPGATRSVPGVFAHLSSLRPRDEITVHREDGTALRYLVHHVELHDKDAFPTIEVYGDAAGSVLRLITCGGEWQEDVHSYDSNVVVFADLS